MFEIGDIVKIIETRYVYSGYSNWGNKHLNNFKKQSMPKKGMICEIVAKEPHSKRDQTIIYGIRDKNSNEYIIGFEGLKFIKRKNYAEDFFGDLLKI